jgi:hypothetical protein
VLSLVLSEPAYAGTDGRTPDEAAAYERLLSATSLPAGEMLPAFIRAQLADGVEPPPPPDGPSPAWMATRPAGAKALSDAFDRFDFAPERIRAFDRPVLFVLGGRSNAELYGRMAARLGDHFPRFTLEVFQERHHFDPPHRAEPDRFARVLEEHWRRGEGVAD